MLQETIDNLSVELGIYYNIIYINYTNIRLDASQSYILRDSFLISLGYQYHPVFKTMHCVECELAVYPEYILTHPGTHGTPVSDLEKTQARLGQYPLNPPQDLRALLPKSGGPPVEGLKIIDGFKCSLCDHSAPSSRTIDNQYLKDHKGLNTPVNDRHQSTKIQRFFSQNYSTYFAVNPSLLSIPPHTPFSTFLRHFKPLPPTETHFAVKTTRDLHPLTVMADWHTHLKSYLESKSKINSILSLCAFPSKDDPMLRNLSEHVLKYLVFYGLEAKKAHYNIRRTLHDYRMYVTQFIY